MRNRQLILLFLFFSSITIYSQTPHLTGTINLSVNQGVFDCNLTLSNLPRLSGYSILLNSGLNVEYFRDTLDQSNFFYQKYYNDAQCYEGFQYYFPSSNNQSRFLPRTFKIKYVGKYPVIADTIRAYKSLDWKGNIACNGKYIRATEQSLWYPVLWDTLNDIRLDKITYDLSVITENERSIYINGSEPTKSKHIKLKSDQAVPLLLLVGDFTYNKTGNLWFVNSDLELNAQTSLSNWTKQITDFYESELKIKYESSVTFMGAQPVCKNRSWLFVSYPTIAVVGNPPNDFNGYFIPETGTIKDSSDISFFCHEFGHYYFGTHLKPNSELYWFFLESLTEYLSIRATKKILGDKYYHDKITQHIQNIKNIKIVPLTKIKRADQIDNIYRYDYAPMLLITLEKQIGEERMQKWLKVMLNASIKRTNYAFFKSTLLASGLTVDEFKKFEDKYISNSSAKENIINVLR